MVSHVLLALLTTVDDVAAARPLTNAASCGSSRPLLISSRALNRATGAGGLVRLPGPALIIVIDFVASRAPVATVPLSYSRLEALFPVPGGGDGLTVPRARRASPPTLRGAYRPHAIPLLLHREGTYAAAA